MNRRKLAEFGLEARRVTLVHSPEVWRSLESDAADAGRTVGDYIDRCMSVVAGMYWNLALLQGLADKLWEEQEARMAESL